MREVYRYPGMPSTIVGALLVGLASPGLAGQEIIELTEAADMCRDCISLRTVAVLGGDYDGDNLLTGSAYVTRSISGRTYVHDFGAGAAEMFFYTSDGQLKFTIRQEGEGPGEYVDPRPIVELPNRRVVVFDQATVRLSILEEDGTFVESSYFPHKINQAHPLNDSVLLVAASIRTPERAGLPFHLVHISGTILESFGREVNFIPGTEGVGFRRMMVLNDSRFLSTSTSGRPYEIERWNGRSLEAVLTREADWFPRRPRSREVAGSPYVSDIYLDGLLLWTIVIVKDPNWTPPAPDAPPVPNSAESLDSEFDTIIEVIDLTVNEVVASQQFDEAMDRLFPDGTILHLAADDLGVALWEIRSHRFRASSLRGSLMLPNTSPSREDSR